jgi:Lon protease-like protein
MKLREHGVQAEQDRIALLLSYDRMVKVFHVKHPVARVQFAGMDNWQVMRVCKDLYNAAPLKQAKKLEKLLLKQENPPDPLIKRLKLLTRSIQARIWLKIFHLKMTLKRWTHAKA